MEFLDRALAVAVVLHCDVLDPAPGLGIVEQFPFAAFAVELQEVGVAAEAV
jgi:hypothetical protein